MPALCPLPSGPAADKGGGHAAPVLLMRRPRVLTRLLDFRQDEDGHWVAVLSCGHTQHLRHQPPWQNRDWVLDPAQRKARIGQHFACGWCAAAAANLALRGVE
ncbi:MAG TPA: hypothetical protein DEH10_15100, partial [Pseudomonas sp.]|nr:hypothetical protein [Pseudomonas sp.]